MALALIFLALSEAGQAQAAAPAFKNPNASLKAAGSSPRGETELQNGDRVPVLGPRWKTLNDSAVTGAGTASGFSVFHAEAKDGFAWKPLALLSAPGIDTDSWIGNTCLTEDGSYVAVVYGPRQITNSEQGFNEGAWGAIVSVHTGKTQLLGRGFSMASFNPGCGAGDHVSFTRYARGKTYLAVVSATTAKADFVTTVDGELTSALPSGDKSVIAAMTHEIVSVDVDGHTQHLAATRGAAYDLRLVTNDLAYIEREDDLATASLLAIDPGSKARTAAAPRKLATGSVEQLGLARDSAGHVYVQGKNAKTEKNLPDTVQRARVDPHATPSVQGSISIESTSPVPTADDAGGSHQALVEIVAKALTSGKDFTLQATPIASQTLSSMPTGRSQTRATSGSSSNPSETERSCAVPRNDPRKQALQPKPRQVEWAVDRAIDGQLSIQRPANWNSAGMSAYSPQGMFPKVALDGGGHIPAQILLGVLAQESNLWQASRYTAPGQTGNPLVGNFYGNDVYDSGIEDAPFWRVDFTNADCGYGVGQVTDGMRNPGHEIPGQSILPAAQQEAIALDYAANIAKSAQMLSDKWNETRQAGVTINNGDSSKVENWFAAVWAYNSGLHPKNGTEPWGLGWLNNPANPIYPPNRHSFLDGSPTDATHPQDWPYPEKVMGFAANSMDGLERQTATTYDAVAGFRTAWWNGDGPLGAIHRTQVKPPLETFCSSENECDTATGAVCSRGDLQCWFHSNATWKDDCDYSCGNELDRFTPAADYMTEQDNGTSFPPACTRDGLPNGALIVDDVPLQADGNLVSAQPANPQCKSAVSTAGSFTFDFGRASGGSYPSKIDLQQLGAGLNAHFYYSHARDTGDGFGSSVTGTWSLGQNLASKWTRVFVHTPDLGAWNSHAEYTVDVGNGKTETRMLPQRTDQNEWRSLGVFLVNGTPKVTLTNITGKDVDRDYADDVDWDAVAFQPLESKPKDFIVSMGDSYSSGEGAPSSTGVPYYRDSDNHGTSERFRDACHRSPEAWSRKAFAGSAVSLGERSDSYDASLDFHQISCSGATTSDMLPDSSELKDQVLEYHELHQLDQGYLDENTTLVTLTAGGNDVGFASALQSCVTAGVLNTRCVFDKDAVYGKLKTFETELPKLLAQIQRKAPNAEIAILGYPPLFQDGVGCLFMNPLDQDWLEQLSKDLNSAIEAAADKARVGSHSVLYADPGKAFEKRTICAANHAINRIMPFVTGFEGNRTLGDKPLFTLPILGVEFAAGVASASIHPSRDGTDLYAKVLDEVLGE